jgi:hypothetical protein
MHVEWDVGIPPCTLTAAFCIIRRLVKALVIDSEAWDREDESPPNTGFAALAIIVILPLPFTAGLGHNSQGDMRSQPEEVALSWKPLKPLE